MANNKSSKKKTATNNPKSMEATAPKNNVVEVKTESKNTEKKQNARNNRSFFQKVDPIAMTCFVVIILAFAVVTGAYVNKMYISDPPAAHVIVSGDKVQVEYTGSFFAYYDKDGAVVFDTNLEAVDQGDYFKSPSYKEKTSFQLFDVTVGSKGALAGFENALIGQTVGKTVRVKISPEEGYGMQPSYNYNTTQSFESSGSLSVSDFNKVFGTSLSSSDKPNMMIIDDALFGLSILVNYDNVTNMIFFQFLGIPDVATEPTETSMDSHVKYSVIKTASGFDVTYTFDEEANAMFKTLDSDFKENFVYKSGGVWKYRVSDSSDRAETKGMDLYFVIKIKALK